MADDEVITEDVEIASSGMDFSDAELTALEEEFTTTDEPAKDEDEDADEEEGAGDEQEEDDTSGDAASTETAEGQEAADDGADRQGDSEAKEDGEEEEEGEEGYELAVDGQPVLVDTEQELMGWAQKGIHYERVAQATQKRMEDATFALNSMLHDPMTFLEEYHTGQNGGNNEAARGICYKIAERYMKPILDEIAADPAKRLQLQQDRWGRRQEINAQQQTAAAQNTYTQEDIQEIQNLERDANSALDRVGLPQDSAPLRKRMAEIMLTELNRGVQMHPIQAAEAVRREVDEYQKAAAKSAPRKGQKKVGKRSKKEKEAAIRRARAKGSRKKTGTGAQARRRSAEPQFMNSREFLAGLNKSLNLDDY